MADITEYLDGLNYMITDEEKSLMDIFAESWEYCKDRACDGCEYRGEGNKHVKPLICISYQYAKRLIAAGYRNVTPPAECKDDELIIAAFGVSPSTLTDREKRIIVLRHGLADGLKRTYEDIGKEYSVTRERIRQLEKKAADKLMALKALTDDVAPVVHGEWLTINDTSRCSECGYIPAYDSAIDDLFYSPYCPNCGAKMDGGKA